MKRSEKSCREEVRFDPVLSVDSTLLCMFLVCTTHFQPGYWVHNFLGGVLSGHCSRQGRVLFSKKRRVHTSGGGGGRSTYFRGFAVPVVCKASR